MNFKYRSLQQIAALLLLFVAGSATMSAQALSDVVCPGQNYNLSVDSVNTTTVWQVSSDGIIWTDSAGTNGLSSLNFVPPVTSRFYRSVTTVDNCDIASEVIELHTSNIAVDVGPDFTVCENTSISITPTIVTEGAPASIMWTATAPFTFPNPNQANQDISSTNDVEAILTVTDTNGCIAIDTMVYSAIAPAPSQSLDFVFFGDRDTFFVFPTCVDTIDVGLWGAPGADGADANNNGLAGSGGAGGFAGGQLVRDNLKGDTIWLFIGGPNGVSGSNTLSGGAAGPSQTAQAGGNGGGSSDVRYGGKEEDDRIGVAGGGGGGGGAPDGSQALFGGQGGDGGDGGTMLAIGGDSLAFGSVGGNATISGGAIQALGGSGGGSGFAVGGDGGTYSGSGNCNSGQDGGDPFGNLDSSGGQGGSGATGPSGGSCDGEGAGGGGAGGGLGGGGGGGGQAGPAGVSYAGAGGGGGGSSSENFVNGGSVVPGAANPHSNTGSIQISW